MRKKGSLGWDRVCKGCCWFNGISLRYLSLWGVKAALGMVLIVSNLRGLLPGVYAVPFETRSTFWLGELKFVITSPMEVTSGSSFTIRVTITAAKSVFFAYLVSGWIWVYVYEDTRNVALITDENVVSSSESWYEGYERTKTYSIPAGSEGCKYSVIISTFHFYQGISRVEIGSGTCRVFVAASRTLSYDTLSGLYDLSAELLEYYQAQVQSLNSTLRSLRSHYDSLNSSYISLQGTYSSLLSQYTSLQSQHTTLQAQYLTLQEKNRQLESDLSSWRLGAILAGAVAIAGVIGFILERRKPKAPSEPAPPIPEESKDKTLSPTLSSASVEAAG